jgi:predicted RND superfamily exporter protein
MVERFDDFFRRRGYADSFSYHMTGPAFLINKTLDRVGRNLKIELFVGSLLLAVLIFYQSRKIKSVLIALISTGLPLVFMAGAMGFLKIDLGIESLVLFFIAFGLTSANSINIFCCQNMNRSCHSAEESQKNQSIQSAKKLITSNCFLALLLVMLLISNFQSIVQLSLSLFICLFFSLLINLCLIPFLKDMGVYRLNKIISEND